VRPPAPPQDPRATLVTIVAMALVAWLWITFWLKVRPARAEAWGMELRRWVNRMAAAGVVGVLLAGLAATASHGVDVSDSRRLVAFSTPTTAAAPTTSTTVAPAPTTTTTAPPATTTTTAAPVRAAAVAAPAAAAAKVPVKPAGPVAAAAPAPQTIEQRGAAALARIAYPWQKLGYSVTYLGNNPGLLGKANCGTHEISIYVRPSQTIQQIAFVTAFELGHAVDCGTMTDATRAEWAAIRGFPAGWKWFPGCLCTEDDFGSGDISMVFANWLVPNGGYSWRSNLAPRPSAEQLDRLVPYLRPAQVA
jgi:hypothetical protein